MKKREIGKLEAITILIISMSIFLYEICFCNLNDIKINNTYNFSLFRIVMYIVFIALYIKFSKKFIKEAEKTLLSKRKIIYIYVVLAILYTIYKITTERNYYVLVLIFLTELNGLLFILYVTKDYIKNIIIITLTLGFIFSISTDINHIVDEKKHFISSLNVAFGNFNFKQGLTDEELNNIDFNLPAINFAREYFNKNTSFNMQKIPEDESIYSTPTDNNALLYIPSSIGINIARLFGGSIADIYFAGRMSNLITYAILMIIIFKLLPFKKDIFYSLYLLPMVFALSGSYSLDGITIGLIGIFIAYLLKIYKEDYNKINLKQIAILMILFIISLMCKNGAYLGICILIFILPISKIIKNNKKILIFISTILILASILGIWQGSKMSNSSSGDIRVDGTSPAKQIEFLLESPTNIIEVYKNYLRQSLFNFSWYTGFNLRVFCGSYYSSITFCLIIFILYISITDCSYTFKKNEKIIMFLTFAVTFFITTLTLYLAYTKVGQLTINGYQARYLIAIMPLILVNVNSRKILNNNDNNDNNICEYNKISLGMGIFMILDLISHII